MSRISGTIKSDKGFYIGDLCYALNDDIYHEVWGGAGYEDGIYTDPASGSSFAVAGTAYGDGTYDDQETREYDVDAGNISLVAGEIVEDTQGGHYFEGAGEATFQAYDGVFDINLPGGKFIHIDTNAEVEDDYEDDYYTEEGEDGYGEDEE